MKHAFDRFIHYLQKNYFSYWVVLGIDTFIALLCTWVSFIGIHYITETSKEIVSLFHILAVSVEGIMEVGGKCAHKGCLHSHCHLVSPATDGIT